MNIKKFMAGAVASVVAVSGMAVASSAADVATASLTWADGVASYYWGASDNAGITNNTVAITGNGEYTINASVAAADEETGGDGPCYALEVLCLDIEFDGTLEDNYPDARVEVTSLTLGSTAITLDFSRVKGSVETVDADTANNYEKPNVLRQNLYNTWGGNIFAFDKPADLTYDSIKVTFTVTGIGGGDSAPADDDNNAGADNTPADDGNNSTNDDNSGASNDGASNGDTNAPTSDKTNADTGVEGVAVVAGLAVVAAGAVIVAKKRK